MAGDMNGAFFDMATAYQKLAEKEGNKDFADKLSHVLTVALRVKKATLRPEIQLLNTLMECKTAQERKEVSLIHHKAFF